MSWTANDISPNDPAAFIAAVPKNANGKVHKRQVRAPYWQAAGRRV